MKKATTFFLLICSLSMFLIMRPDDLTSFAVNQYYVAQPADGGSDSNNGTSPSTPWATCAKVFNATSGFVLGANGAVVNFKASATPYTSCNITRGGSSLSVRLALRCLTSWTIGGVNCKWNNGLQVTTANDVDIGAIGRFGFEISGVNAEAVDVNWQCGTASTCATGNSIHVFGNYFHDLMNGSCPSAGAIGIPNVHGATSPDSQVIGNVIDHIGVFPSPTGNQTQGIYIATANGIVYDNIVTRVCYAGLQYYDQGSGARIANNVFANNTVGMVLYGSNGVTPGLNTVDNNVIVNNTQQAFNNSFSGDQGCASGRQTLYSNNDVSGNGTNGFTSTPASCTLTQNQKSESPTTTFVNYTGDASGDYHLKSGSVAIGGGTTQGATGQTGPFTPTMDLANNLFGTPPDIGAFASGAAVSLLSLTPTSFSYGAIQVGGHVDHTFVLANNAVATVTLSTTNVTGAGFSIFSNSCGGSITTSGTCNIVVRSAPTTAGSFSGALTITHTASNSPISSTFTATGIQGAVTANPPSMVFPVQNVGTSGTAPIGFADNFGTGSLSSLWAKDSGTAPGNIAGVNNGTFSTANVDLTHGMLGLKVTQGGSAPVTSVGAEVRSVATYGYGTYSATFRAASTSTTPTGVGTPVSGQISSAFEFISNSLTEIDSPEIEGQTPNVLEWTNFFTTANSQSTSTTPGFAPDQAQHTYSANWQPTQIIFSVDGTPVSTHTLNIPITPASALFNLWGTNSTSFGGVATTGTRWMWVSGFSYSPFSNDVYIYNTGSAPMTFSSPPSANGDFSVSTNCPVSPATLAVGAFCKATVTFTPTVTGPRTGTLTIASDAAVSPLLIPLSGTGQPSIVQPTGFVMTSGVFGVH